MDDYIIFMYGQTKGYFKIQRYNKTAGRQSRNRFQIWIGDETDEKTAIDTSGRHTAALCL